MTVEAAIDFQNELDHRLRRTNQQLGATGLRVAKFIDENRQIVLASSAAALGARIGTSDATVLRTIQTLGFASLADLKGAILNAGPVSTPADDMRRTLVDLEKATGQALDGILQAHADGLDILRSEKCRAQIAASVRVLDAANRIAVFGIGPSSALATYVSILLARNGRRSRTINATGSMLADQLLDLGKGDALLILAYGRLYREVKAVFAEAKALGLPTVLVTEADDTPLAKLADVCVAIPRGRPGQVALHGATLVGLEALVLSLAAAKPQAALSSLDNLNRLRRATEAQGKSAK
ncbi:MurR/RpiR family transcriptional regulator [Bradyrhizobium canariense]|uniref:Transcriptional regulator, RpiR family n=1 Tax=Bradyrhizobium canariense TaxID=255045 RepID=A0A1H1UH28_9BRAD|nr:MurR/RpiR family transcriptional regulator [Bradyrhizobium canariense]SDS71805.1 transcriptional regulator, RpiR family [Bradyrhizobium canariense]